MKFFYTINTKFNDVQKEPNKSLGGYVSSSLVPNDLLGNIFPLISLNLIEKKYREVRGIVLQNDSNVALVGVENWFILPADGLCKFRISFVALAQDTCGYFMERLQSDQALPYSATFYEPTESSKINLGNIPAGGYLGIWLERTINEEAILTDQELYDKWKLQQESNTKPPTKESISMKLSWT